MALIRCARCLIVLCLATTVWGQTEESDDGKVEVQLRAEHSALVPGQVTTLALEFRIEPDWHIYWQNRGEGGLEPRFKWRVPDGFKVGPVRFPPPARRVDSTGAHTFILEGEPILLADLFVPPDVKPGKDVTLGVDVEWLACKELCIVGEKSLSIQLSVVAEGGEAEPADPITFKSARASLPAAPDKAKHVRSVVAAASVDRIPSGGTFEVAVTVEVQPGHHLNSSTPLNKFAIPTDLFPYKSEGLTFGRPKFPPGEVEQQAPDIQNSVYRNKFTILLPVTASGAIERDEIELGGVVTYQACSDVTKMCFPPASVEYQLRLPVAKAGEAVQQLTLASQSEDRGFLRRLQDGLMGWGVAGQLLLAFLGGFILNFMPCVLPVISLKILSFVQQAKESRIRVLTLGLVFATGILVSFILLGLLILGLLSGLGLSQVQWGGLFQRPEVVIVLAAVVTALALSLFGVFTLSPPRFVNDLGGRVEGEGHLGAFATGLLATVLGTACTAPFLSVAIAAAVQQPPAVALLIFVTAGVGMAWPYILLAAVPAWIRIIPRPGPWMKTFEHVMGFLMLGTVIWLLNPLAHQLGPSGFIWVLVFLLFVAAAAWCYGRVDYGTRPARRMACYGGSVLLVAVGWWWCFLKPEAVEIAWVPYTRERALELVREGKTVFVDYTAEWCVNCKSNEKLVLNTEAVRGAIDRLGVVPMKADYTSFDKQIEEDLKRFNRSGVPMYVIFPANRPDEPILLNEILTTSAVIEGLEKAGPSAKPVAWAPYSREAGRPEEPVSLDGVLTASDVVRGVEQAAAAPRSSR